MVATSATFTGPRYYDEYLGPAYFGPFASALADRLPDGFPGPVLEVACGTGLVTRLLRQRLPSATALVATDLSPAMLDYARSLSPGADVGWQQADAQELPFGDGSFGAVVCGFGFMFAADRPAALREARRVLAAGGTLLFDVWDRIEENPHALAGARVIEELFPDDPKMKFRVPYEMHDDDALLAERGVDLEQVVARLAAALEHQGGRPYQGHAQALLVEATAA